MDTTIASSTTVPGGPGAGAPRRWSDGPPPGERVDRYLVGDRLGAGGMGIVVRARDQELGRDVALKFLRPELGGERHRARLLREARVMAQLKHPNVVAIYDLGDYGDQTWLAMEYVDGTTLRAAMDGARPWDEVWPLFRAAARGLAAAHEVGIVHRDFKPENVLVDAAGGAHVADFGLAYPTGGADSQDDRVDGAAALSPEARLTQTGSIVGTPGYMPPEQHRGEALTAAADQFAFCVALYEGLYGEPPFAGKSVADLAERVTAGDVRPDPGGQVPGWRRRVLLRGLSAEPADRFPSMKALVAALEADPRARRRRWLLRSAVAVAAAAAVTYGIVRVRAAGANPCDTGDPALAAAWNNDRAAKVRAAVVAADPVRGAERATFVTDRLGRYARSLATMGRQSCRATRVAGTQSDSMLDRRAACLGDRRAALGALTDLIASGDAKAIRHAEQLVARLPDPGPCSDTEALGALIPPPSDPIKRAAVTSLFDDIRATEALRIAGKYDRATHQAEAEVARAQRLDYAPIIAKALFLRGDLQCRTGHFDDCETTIKRSIEAAAAGHDDRQVAQNWIGLISDLLSGQDQVTRARDLLPAARAAVARIGANNPHLRFRLLQLEADLVSDGGDKALPLIDEAERLAASDPRATDGGYPALADLLLTKARVLINNERWADAEHTLLDALAHYRASLGPEHPDTHYPLDYLATMDRRRGFPAAAVPLYERAIQICARGLGPRHPETARMELQLSYAMSEVGLPALSRLHAQRALDIQRTALPPDHPQNAYAHIAIGLSSDDQHDAIAHYTMAIALFEKIGETGDALANAYRNRAESKTTLKDYDGAMADYDRSEAIYTKAYGADYPELLILHVGAGQALLEAHRYPDAIRHLERARAMNPDGDHVLQDRMTRFFLGRALYESGRDRARAVGLLRGIRAELAGLADHGGELGQRVERWFATHKV